MSSVTPARAGRKEWIGLAVLALPCILYSMDLTVLHLAVPALSQDLSPSATQLLWIIDIYGFMVAGMLITMGTLGDRIGRRRLLLSGAAAFGIASVLAAFSTSPEMLIATRALLGIAGATVAPSTLSLIRNMFPHPKQFAFAIGIWISAYSVGGALGPVIGGVLLEYFWWGSVFLIAVPVMVLLLVLGPMLLPEYRDPEAGKPDLPSAMLSLVGVLAVIYGIKQLAEHGLSGLAATSIMAGLVVGIIFVRRQRRLADPLIDLRLFSDRSFSTSLAAYTLSIVAVFGGFLFIPQYLQLVEGMSPLRAGLWTLPWPLAFVVGSMATPVIVRRIRPAYLMATGLAMAALGNVLITQIESAFGLAALVVGMLIIGLGLAPTFTLATELIVGSAPPERAGAASAVSEIGAEFGGALGIALFGSLGTAIYRRELTDTMPAGVPPEAAASARETLGAAAESAGQLPGQLGIDLLEAARNSFVSGLHVSAVTSAAMVAILAVLAAIVLRDLRPRTESDEQSDAPEILDINQFETIDEAKENPWVIEKAS